MTLTSTRELTRSKQHLDLSVLGSELDGAVKEVQENLLQAIRIAGNPPGEGIHHDLQTNAFRLRRWSVASRLTRSGQREDRSAAAVGAGRLFMR